MKVAFLHLDISSDGRRLAEIMVASVRKAMPGVEIVHLANDSTPIVTGADRVVRRDMEFPWLMLYRLDHFKNLPQDEWMFIDTDAVVQKDPSGVFRRSFDVALTKREGPILVNGKDIVPEMPYNSGVMFSRCKEFWEDVYNCCSLMPDERKHWFGDQQALKVVVDSGKHEVIELTCDEYNYSPNNVDEDLTGKYVIHLKGVRKKFMPQLAEMMGVI